MSFYYYDEEDDSYYDEDREPDCTSYHLSLCKDKRGNVYLHELVLGGWYGVSWSFGYPDTVIEESTLGLKAVQPDLASALRERAERLQPGMSEDITYFCREFYANVDGTSEDVGEIPF